MSEESQLSNIGRIVEDYSKPECAHCGKDRCNECGYCPDCYIEGHYGDCPNRGTEY